MKLIIDINEEEYNKFVDADKEGYCGRMIDTKVIVNGTPLDDIKAEINDLSELDHIDADYEDCKADVLEIIDKHTGK